MMFALYVMCSMTEHVISSIDGGNPHGFKSVLFQASQAKGVPVQHFKFGLGRWAGS